MKLNSNRTLFIALIVTTLLGIWTVTDYLKMYVGLQPNLPVQAGRAGLDSQTSNSNDHQRLKPQDWLTTDTSSEQDPMAGAMFIRLFLKNKVEDSLALTQEEQQISAEFPNLIYAALASSDTKNLQPGKERIFFEQALQARWRVTVSWNSARIVTMADGQQLTPELVEVWTAGNQVKLMVLTADDNQAYALMSNNQYLQQLALSADNIIASYLPENQTQFSDQYLQFSYTKQQQLEVSYDYAGALAHYVVKPVGENEPLAAEEVTIQLLGLQQVKQSFGVDDLDRVKEQLAQAYLASSRDFAITSKPVQVAGYPALMAVAEIESSEDSRQEPVSMVYVIELDGSRYLVLQGKMEAVERVIETLEIKE